MKYSDYELVEEKNSIRIIGIQDFVPEHIFECGQCFRWQRQEDSSYTGVAYGKVINVSIENNDVVIKNTNMDDFKRIWFHYFDLGTDYEAIKRLVETDDVMRAAIQFGHGIRILKQEFIETLISFIISANKSIPMIKRVVETISKSYGEKLNYNGSEFYSFPTVSELSQTSLPNLMTCGAGYRCKYIYRTSKMIEDEEVDLEHILKAPLADARKELNKFPGVGPKISDCVLLFSGINNNVFPTDVWVKRVMEALYFKQEISLGEIQKFAKDKFGDLTGYAQQYLFYYARENKIGSNSIQKE